ncbi:MAG: hypothetical protein P8X83_03600 [Nitrosopumilaceae archaeon]
MSGGSGDGDKLYFYIYESHNKVTERIPLTIHKESDLEKTLDSLDFETLVKKVGFYQR